jgi:hypothetical protein
MPGVQIPHCAAPWLWKLSRQPRVAGSLCDQAGERVDARPVRLWAAVRQAQTGVAVQQHGAGAAIAGVAADLDVPRAQGFPQKAGQALSGHGAGRDLGAVQHEGDPVACDRLIH